MKILIHSVETGLYIAEEDQWVQSMAGARDFLHASDAINYISAKGLANVELTYAFPSNEYNITIPVARSAPAGQDAVSERSNAP